MSKKLSEVVDGAVVAIYYTLKSADGEVVDSNRRGGKPLVFLQGKGQVLPAIEAALVGKKKDEHVVLELPPAQGYGERKEENVRKVPRSAFPPRTPLELGARFVLRDDQGRNVPALVVELDDEEVTVDHNHPLAGQTLFFDITVAGIREASAEEVQHGHAHGPGGHHH